MLRYLIRGKSLLVYTHQAIIGNTRCEVQIKLANGQELSFRFCSVRVCAGGGEEEEKKEGLTE